VTKLLVPSKVFAPPPPQGRAVSRWSNKSYWTDITSWWYRNSNWTYNRINFVLYWWLLVTLYHVCNIVLHYCNIDKSNSYIRYRYKNRGSITVKLLHKQLQKGIFLNDTKQILFKKEDCDCFAQCRTVLLQLLATRTCFGSKT